MGRIDRDDRCCLPSAFPPLIPQWRLSQRNTVQKLPVANPVLIEVIRHRAVGT